MPLLNRCSDNSDDENISYRDVDKTDNINSNLPYLSEIYILWAFNNDEFDLQEFDIIDVKSIKKWDVIIIDYRKKISWQDNLIVSFCFHIKFIYKSRIYWYALLLDNSNNKLLSSYNEKLSLPIIKNWKRKLDFSYDLMPFEENVDLLKSISENNILSIRVLKLKVNFFSSFINFIKSRLINTLK